MADTREPSPRSRQVYRGGQPEEDKDDKTKTPGDVLAESGEYLKDPETEVDTSQPLQVNTSPSFEIDPNKSAKDPRTKATEEKLRRRAGGGQQGADIAREKLKRRGGDPTDLPQFLQVTDLQKQDSQENSEWDRINQEVREKYMDENFKPIPGSEREIVDTLLGAARRLGKIKTPQGQMEMIQVAAGISTAVLMGVLEVSRGLMFSY